ncbi:hypothetical protein SCP_0800810 [Sparassis crispa]|uniref:Myosin motor domain-containing protein n=1 Tax=Sparassis crispa TaxID=139825 RepID=A0A401GV03_9APHY|nr:hypothetical protein SCP_0800810 [Sparassis crispa]GBE85564.1 hypothetical protein SCP_0800810 [Sparassis crispa]
MSRRRASWLPPSSISVTLSSMDRSRNEDAAVVRNTDVLDIVADFLGVQPAALEAALSYRTKMLKKELCTVFLDPDGASDNRDELAKSLYSLLFAWLNEHINPMPLPR